MESTKERTLAAALSTVFEETPCGLRPASINHVSLAKLNRAFRQKALRTHPDMARVLGRSVTEMAADFRRLHEAYQYLKGALNTGSPQHADARPAAAAKRSPSFYGGPLPRRRLRFAEFVYYCGIIHWNHLIGAMAWQHRVRPRFGDLACELHFFDQEAVLEILRKRRADERFGETALRLGLLDAFRQFVVLGRQRRYDAPVGRYFVEQGIISRRRLEQLLAANQEHNRRFP
jgi:hypothetical protein